MPAQTLRAALRELQKHGIKISGTSQFYVTPAWPDPNDPPFVNAVSSIETDLDPLALLEVLHEVEERFGRTRTEPNAPRSLDLDLLDYNGLVQSGPPVLPHPRMEHRAFVLVPLFELVPYWLHPSSGTPVARLLEAIGHDGVKAIISK